MKNLWWIVCGLGLITWSCTSDEKKSTASGIELNYLNEGTGQSPTQGDVMLLHMKYADEDGKSLFDTEQIGDAVPVVFDTTGWKDAGVLYEVFAILKVGDSLQFDIPATDLFQKSFRIAVPDSIRPESNITFNLGVENSLSREAYTAQRNAVQNEIDGNLIKAYLAENGISAITTESGLRYVITTEGSGPNATAGSQVVVHYNGTLLDGTKFDSSYDRGQPFSFVLGQGRVIRGWDEGIALLNKGSKATLYIPSSLAYGERGSGATIQPNSVLKFDVELVDIQ